MTVEAFSVSHFRCLGFAEFEFSPGNNLIYGANASGKTSVLEALAFLARGKSFRGAATAELVAHGQREFVLFGRVRGANRVHKLGVRNGLTGPEIRIDGETGRGTAGLAEVLPLQVIDPEVHDLVAGSPDRRRRYLDWIAFHVEHGYLDSWRRFGRALKQRNAALRSGASAASIRSWDHELGSAGATVDAARRSAVSSVEPALRAMTRDLLGHDVTVDYHGGWPLDVGLDEALRQGLERDRQLGSTHYGPQRAELKVKFDARPARKQVSRGQQKLLACAMVLAAAEVARQRNGRSPVMLLDDPAAELDRGSLGRLMARVAGLGAQVIATSLEPDGRLFEAPPATFHVEHGTTRRPS